MTASAARPTRILGIDPGSRVTGWGVVDCAPRGARFVACGTIRTAPGADLAARLRTIHDAVRELCREHAPDEVAVERAFVSDNADTALKLGQARAAAICGTFDLGPTLHEYAPATIKQALVGSGAATKEQVQHMVRALLALRERLASDASDALAAALCHAHGRGARGRYAAALAAVGGGRRRSGLRRGRRR
jgi:crossover junction endodeoxyribonuclease RuvC